MATERPARPETLVEVPGYQETVLEIARADGATALGELARQTFDPEIGELAGYLALVGSDVEGILNETYERVRGELRLTEQMVEDFASMEGLGDALDKAFGASTLYSAVEGIKSTGAGRRESSALHAGLNRMVFDAMLAASTLYSGRENVNYATAHVRPALLAGFDARVFREAMGSSTLYSGQQAIDGYGTGDAQPAMHRGFDRRVRSEALKAPTLYSAVETTKGYSSEGIDVPIRIDLNERVRNEAVHAPTSRGALDTVRSYGYGQAKSEMEREVAIKWLPKEQTSLQEAVEEVEEFEQRLKDYDNHPRWKKVLKFFSGEKQKLETGLENARMMEDYFSGSVSELWEIMDPQ
jgi:hypothetical protein